jgi:hypothetical protein
MHVSVILSERSESKGPALSEAEWNLGLLLFLSLLLLSLLELHLLFCLSSHRDLLLQLLLLVILSEAKNPCICLSGRSEATYPPKINPEKLHKIHPTKTRNQQTIFTTQSTTLRPQNHHILHPLSPKTPAKSTSTTKTKKRPGQKPEPF